MVSVCACVCVRVLDGDRQQPLNQMEFFQHFTTQLVCNVIQLREMQHQHELNILYKLLVSYNNFLFLKKKKKKEFIAASPYTLFLLFKFILVSFLPIN